MARVARKHVQSGIYLDELAVLLARLDSTLVLLDGSNGS
jgi:hypothetical protein